MPGVPAVDPKFGHRQVAMLGVGDRVQKIAGAVRFNRELQAAFVRELTKGAGVILVVQLHLGAEVVALEAFGLVGVFDRNAAGQCEEPRGEIVTAALAEFLGHSRRPIL